MCQKLMNSSTLKHAFGIWLIAFDHSLTASAFDEIRHEMQLSRAVHNCYYEMLSFFHPLAKD